MRNIFSSLFLLVIALLVGCSEAPREDMSNTIIVGTSPDNPPFELYETDGGKRLTGFDIELMELVAEKLGKKIEFKEMEFSSLIPALITGRIHVIASALTKTPERAKRVDFTATYKTSTPVIVIEKHLKKDAEKRLNGLRLAAQLGSTHEETLKALNRENNNEIKSVPINKLTEMIQELRNDRIDGFLTELDNGLNIANKYDEWSYLELPDYAESYSFALRLGNPLRDEINSALEQLRADGTLAKLSAKWFAKPEGSPAADA